MNKKWMIWMIAFGVVLLSLAVLAACSSAKPTAESESAAGEECTEIPKPDNAGAVGAAVGLTGDATAGATIFADKCAVCHGDQGKGGVANPGAEEPTVPELNPIDACMKNADAKTYATNIDLFIEWGTQLEGATKNMPAFGQQAVLTQQQIADVIAYVISLNK